jgi:hypothetical protein
MLNFLQGGPTMTTLREVISARLAVKRTADELRLYSAPGKFYPTTSGFDELVTKHKEATEEYALARTEWANRRGLTVS